MAALFDALYIKKPRGRKSNLPPASIIGNSLPVKNSDSTGGVQDLFKSSIIPQDKIRPF